MAKNDTAFTKRRARVVDNQHVGRPGAECMPFGTLAAFFSSGAWPQTQLAMISSLPSNSIPEGADG